MQHNETGHRPAGASGAGVDTTFIGAFLVIGTVLALIVASKAVDTPMQVHALIFLIAFVLGIIALGAHHFGGATFAVDVRELQPEEVIYHDEGDKQWVEFRYPNGIAITHNRPNTDNLAVDGTPGETREPKAVPTYKGQGGIYGDFIHCVKTRETPFRDIELAVNSVALSHLATIAYRVRRSLKWDVAAQEFPGDAEANRFLDRARREPWAI